MPITDKYFAGFKGGPATTTDPVPAGIVDSSGNWLGDTTHPLQVQIAGPSEGTETDRSGTLAAGATSQQVAAANTARKYFFFQNVSASVMWLAFGGAAVQNQPSRKLVPGAGFAYEGDFCNTASVNVIGVNIGDAYVCKEA